MAHIRITEGEIDHLLNAVKSGAPPIPLSFGPGWVALDDADPAAAGAAEVIRTKRTADADALKSTVTDAIAEELAGHLLGRAPGDEAPDDSFPSTAAQAVFRALKDAGYLITRKATT